MVLLSSVVALLGASYLCSAATVEDCPGYTATNVFETATGLTADLSLAGEACNAYGYDLGSLKLLVEYQTGNLPINFDGMASQLTLSFRHSAARENLRCCRDCVPSP